MKKLMSMFCILFLSIGISSCDEFHSPDAATTFAVAESSTPLFYWYSPYGGVCAHRNDRMDTYNRAEIEGSDLIMSSEGSLLTGYYENDELRIIKIAVYQSRHKVILRYYPIGDAVAIIEETIRYASGEPLSEITEDDFYLDEISQAIIKDDQLFQCIDQREPMVASDNTWYAEIYAKAVEALNDAGASG